MLAACGFPFENPATAGAGLVVAIGAGVVLGWLMRPDSEMTGESYRERYGYAPLTSLVAQMVCFSLCVAVLAIQAFGVYSLCDDRKGAGLLLIAPGCATALAYGFPWMLRVIARDRGERRERVEA